MSCSHAWTKKKRISYFRLVELETERVTGFTKDEHSSSWTAIKKFKQEPAEECFVRWCSKCYAARSEPASAGLKT